MKMSYRDKVILIVLLVILVWAIGIMYFIKPKFESLDRTNKEYDSVVATLKKKEAQVEEEKDLKERVQAAYENANKLASIFYDRMGSPEASILIDTLLDEDNIVNDSLALSPYSSTTLDFVNSTPYEATTEIDKIAQRSQQLGKPLDTITSDSVQSASGPAELPAFTATFGYECKLEDLKAFFDHLLAAEQCSLIVTDCTIDDVNEEKVKGNITMVLIMVPRYSDPFAADEAAKKAAEEAGDSSES